MFAQESVMGIKKEREAFERLPLAELAIESEFVFYNEETNSYWPNEDFCPSDAAETMNFAWEAWQAAKAHEAEKLKGCVLVPVQCPDPDFADSLFDELSKKAIGEFGDDLLIHFSDIDEEKIWALMVEAAKAQAVPEGFVILKASDVREILSNASDAMDAESPPSVFTQTGIPSTWYDHHLVTEKNILDAIKAQEPTND